MRFLRYSLSGLFLVALTAALLVFAGTLIFDAVETRMADEPRPSRDRERVFTVSVITATLGEEQPSLTTFGQMTSARTLELRAASAGTVLELSPEFVEGGEVAVGETLLRIDPANAQSALAKAQSDLQDAKLEVRDAAKALELAQDDLAAASDQAALRQKAFERQTDLASRGVGTSAAVETAELAASSARQAVLARRQSLAQAEARNDQSQTRLTRAELAQSDAERKLEDTELTAEFAGTLSNVSIVRGGLVSNNEQLARLIDPSRMEVSFRVSTAQYARLLHESGALRAAEVTVVLDVLGADLTARGRISRDSAVVAEGQSGRLIFAKMDSAPGFKPGDFVRVIVTEPLVSNVARLPATALGSDGAVLALAQEDRLEKIAVELVRRQGDDVLVRAPSLNGRDIVVARTPLLGGGIKVKPLRGAKSRKIKDPDMLELSADRRAKIRAFVEANKRIPDAAKARILSQLEKDKVPARMVERIESRMGG